jgi:hypothetical protein
VGLHQLLVPRSKRSLDENTGESGSSGQLILQSNDLDQLSVVDVLRQGQVSRVFFCNLMGHAHVTAIVR